MRVFRDDVVDLVGSYQFDDQVTEGGDVFARDPYILRFRCLNTGEKRFLFEGFYMRNVSAQMWRSIWVFFFAICVSTSVLKDLVMIPVHTKPEDSEKELDELYDVFLNVTQKWATDVRWRLPP